MNERFGPYQLLRYFAAGGMADLYLARRPPSDEPLILKRIQARHRDHRQVLELFVDEGRIAQTLDHPNIVRTIDVGAVEGTHYIAMEYIPGRDLIAIVERAVESGRALPRGIILAIGAQVAAGLAYAHTHRDQASRPLAIAHCDISPGNIVVSRRGIAKIVDFGIARATIALRKQDGILGKCHYMAPEQIRGEPIDGRADLYSLGVILWELTIGRRLFRGPAKEVRRRVIAGEIPAPRSIRPDYPEALEALVLRLLSPNRSDRFTDGAIVAEELTALAAADGGAEPSEIAAFLRDLFQGKYERTVPVPTDSAAEAVDRAMPALEAPFELLLDEESGPIPSATTLAERLDREQPRIPRDRARWLRAIAFMVAAGAGWFALECLTRMR